MSFGKQSIGSIRKKKSDMLDFIVRFYIFLKTLSFKKLMIEIKKFFDKDLNVVYKLILEDIENDSSFWTYHAYNESMFNPRFGPIIYLQNFSKIHACMLRNTYNIKNKTYKLGNSEAWSKGLTRIYPDSTEQTLDIIDKIKSDKMWPFEVGELYKTNCELYCMDANDTNGKEQRVKENEVMQFLDIEESYEVDAVIGCVPNKHCYKFLYNKNAIYFFEAPMVLGNYFNKIEEVDEDDDA